MSPIKSSVALLATIAIAAGCATSGVPEMASSTAPLPPLEQETLIDVQNHNWSDIVVYAAHGSSRVRLGMVTSMNTERFDLPRAVQASSAQMRLIAAPIGSPSEFSTEPIQVQPGQRVELRLENVLSISNWSVW